MTPKLVQIFRGVLDYLNKGRFFDEAAVIDHQMVVLFRRSAKVAPDIYQPYLATTLLEYGMPLHSNHHQEDASSVREEALGIKRQLHHVDPSSHSSDLALYLRDLGRSLYALSQPRQAANVTAEAVEVLRELHRASPDSPHCAESLIQSQWALSETYRLANRNLDALAAIQDAVPLALRLFEKDAKDRNLLSIMWCELGVVLRRLSDYSEACSVYQKGLDLLRGSAGPQTNADIDNLAMLLITYSSSSRGGLSLLRSRSYHQGGCRSPAPTTQCRPGLLSREARLGFAGLRLRPLQHFTIRGGGCSAIRGTRDMPAVFPILSCRILLETRQLSLGPCPHTVEVGPVRNRVRGHRRSRWVVEKALLRASRFGS